MSHDVIGESASCLFDAGLTRAVGNTVKVFGWYDNEWGYAQRTVDLVDLIAGNLPGRWPLRPARPVTRSSATMLEGRGPPIRWIIDLLWDS